ncbi:MAG: DegT/DnrJ/EryC1/StrS family aminotransferase [Solirubrobacteraceae bacterium]
MSGTPAHIVRFQRPAMPSAERIEHHFSAAREARFFSNGGPCVQRLAVELEARTGAPAIPVGSGTAGLQAAVAAVTGPPEAGRPVLVPSFTFVATVQAVLAAGHAPHLVDVAPDHWHLDPAALTAALERRRPVAVLAVSTFGTPPPPEVREAWSRACREAGVPLVLDSAAGFGAEAEDGTPVGAQADVEVVSFHATKPFAIGEGGAVFAKAPEAFEAASRMTNFGFDADRRVVEDRGLNAKMSELHAATALAALETFDASLARRRASAGRVLEHAGHLDLQSGCARSTWQYVPVRFADEATAAAAEARAIAAVETRRYYQPVHLEPAFADLPHDGLAVTEDLARRIICFPMAADLSDEEERRIAAAITA